MKRNLFLILIVALLVSAGLFFFGRRVEVETVSVSRGEIVRTVEEDATVEVPGDRQIFATQLARVLEVPVEAGDRVIPGQILVRMKNADLDVSIAETRTMLDQASKERRGTASRVASVRLLLEDARKNSARWERLYEEGAVSLSELEETRLAAARLEKDLSEALSAEGSAAALESGLGRTFSRLEAKRAELAVKSPITGVVLEVPAEKDRVFLPGELVVTVAPGARMEIVSDVLSDALRGVTVGQRVRVSAPILGGEVLEGRVSKIYPQAFEKLSALGVVQRRVKVKVIIPYAPLLKPGFEVRVAIETARHPDVLLLPVEAVRTSEKGDRVVLKVEGGKIRNVPVKTGMTNRRSVEILEGLGEGDTVLADAGLDIAEGTRVRAQR